MQKESKFSRQRRWHRWFAWYPVMVKVDGGVSAREPGSDVRVWWQPMYRRKIDNPSDPMYGRTWVWEYSLELPV